MENLWVIGLIEIFREEAICPDSRPD